MIALNLGCGPVTPPGWVHCDRLASPGVHVRLDLRTGLPFRSGSVDRIVAIHVLQDLEWRELAPLLAELFRVLAADGALRIAVPDLDRAIAAYLTGDGRYFYVPDEHARSVGAKLVTQLVWYGSVRTPMTFGFLEEWLAAAGFVDIPRRAHGVSAVPGMAALDNRERESLFVDARKPAG